MNAVALESRALINQARAYENVLNVSKAVKDLQAGLGDLKNDKTVTAMNNATKVLRYLNNRLQSAVQENATIAMNKAKAAIKPVIEQSNSLLEQAKAYNDEKVSAAAKELQAGLESIKSNTTADAMNSAAKALNYLNWKLTQAIQSAH